MGQRIMDVGHSIAHVIMFFWMQALRLSIVFPLRRSRIKPNLQQRLSAFFDDLVNRVKSSLAKRRSCYATCRE